MYHFYLNPYNTLTPPLPSTHYLPSVTYTSHLILSHSATIGLQGSLWTRPPPSVHLAVFTIYLAGLHGQEKCLGNLQLQVRHSNATLVGHLVHEKFALCLSHVTHHSPQLKWHSLCYSVLYLLFCLRFPLNSTYYDALVVSPSPKFFFILISITPFFITRELQISSLFLFRFLNHDTPSFSYPFTALPLYFLSFSALPTIICSSSTPLLPPLLHPLHSLYSSHSSHSSPHPCRHNADEQWRQQ
jgi:hypothetical protein